MGTVVIDTQQQLRLTRLERDDASLAPHDVRGAYVEHFWLPIVGPTAYLLLRRLDLELSAASEWDVINVDTTVLGVSMGVGSQGGRHSALNRGLGRLVQFNLVHWMDDVATMAVPRTVITVPGHFQRRWPEPIRERHAEFLAMLHRPVQVIG